MKEEIEELFRKGLEYSLVQNPDGTCRDMTEEEKANFKPTHIETVSSRESDGAILFHSYEIATGKQTTTELKWHPDDIKFWKEDQNSKQKTKII